MLNLIQLLKNLILIFNLISIISCNNNDHTKIGLRKIELNLKQNFSHSRFAENDNYIFINTHFHQKKLIYYDKNTLKKINEINLESSKLRRHSFFMPDNNNNIWLFKTGSLNSKKNIPPKLIKIEFKTGNIIEKEIPFNPQAALIDNSNIIIVGVYNNNFLHVFNENGNLISSNIEIEDNFISTKWILSAEKFDNEIIISDAEKYRIWHIKNNRLLKKIIYRQDKDLIKIDKIRGKKKIYRQKGIHSIFESNGKIYASCFDHSGDSTLFWYDIVNIKNNKLMYTQKTKFLYNFYKYGNNHYIYKGYGNFELYEVIFQ